ncbi:hypothetical protein [Streptomyces sp. NPDC059850]|uniref:hypothetical protein n=1 Tax=Streptomyces sp. NPDC059850 TaxID=3346970 RepID=UPI00365B1187
MRTSVRRTSRVLALVLGAVTSVTALSGSASADDMDAPYARAAAKVAQDGTVLASKNVASVTRGTGTSAAGVYCVRVSDPNVIDDLADAAVVATVNDFRGEITAIGAPHGYCGRATDTITIVTGDSAGRVVDRPFTVAVL